MQLFRGRDWTAKGRWFHSAAFDLCFFHLPIWLTWVLAFAVPDRLLKVPIHPVVWLLAVLCIDVAHVWSSIWLTYFDRQAFTRNRSLFRAVPLFCFAACFGLALVSETLFWRILAYFAVYHFIKQQVGVAALYRVQHLRSFDRKVDASIWSKCGFADRWCIYAGTLGPLIWWHFSSNKQISWFVSGDFLATAPLLSLMHQLPAAATLFQIARLSFFICWLSAIAYWVWLHLHTFGWRSFPLGKGLWILGTCYNWYLGIIVFDSDFVFTLTNVVAHGIPYFGLVALTRWRTMALRSAGDNGTPKLLLLMLFGALVVLFFAYLEEYCWNMLVYREYATVFQTWFAFPLEVLDNPWARAFFIGILSLPQTVHYVLDGFIWKPGTRNPELNKILFIKNAQA